MSFFLKFGQFILAALSLAKQAFTYLQARMSKQAGIDEERARAAEGAQDVLEDMADIQAQRPDPEKLRRRFDEGTF